MQRLILHVIFTIMQPIVIKYRTYHVQLHYCCIYIDNTYIICYIICYITHEIKYIHNYILLQHGYIAFNNTLYTILH